MSKNLESEYKNFINDQIPDLWDRIEAGLGEQDPKETENISAAPAGKTAVPRRRFWKPFLGIAAAAACVAVVVPLALSVGSGHSTGSAAMTAEALPEEMNYKEASAAAEAYYEDELYEASAEEAAPAQALYDSAEACAETEAAYDAAEDAASDAAAGRKISDGSAALGTETAKEAASEYAIEEAEEAAEAAEVPEAEEVYEEAAAEEPLLETEYTLTNVEFRITSVSEEDLAAGKVTAEIIACPDEPSLAGSILTLESADDTDGVPAEPGTYVRNIFVSVNESGTIVYKI